MSFDVKADIENMFKTYMKHVVIRSGRVLDRLNI